jgi:hypothetical protein
MTCNILIIEAFAAYVLETLGPTKLKLHTQMRISMNKPDKKQKIVRRSLNKAQSKCRTFVVYKIIR